MGRGARLITCAELAAGSAAVAAAVAFSSAAEWDDPWLLVLLLALAIASDTFAVVTDRGLNVSGSFLAIVLAMALVGPTGAVIVGVVSAVVDAILERRPLDSAISNASTYAIFPLAGAVVLERLTDVIDAPVGSLAFAAILLLAFGVSLAVNFLLIAAYHVYVGRATFGEQVRVLPAVPPLRVRQRDARRRGRLYLPRLGIAAIASSASS